MKDKNLTLSLLMLTALALLGMTGLAVLTSSTIKNQALQNNQYQKDLNIIVHENDNLKTEIDKIKLVEEGKIQLEGKFVNTKDDLTNTKKELDDKNKEVNICKEESSNLESKTYNQHLEIKELRKQIESQIEQIAQQQNQIIGMINQNQKLQTSLGNALKQCNSQNNQSP